MSHRYTPYYCEENIWHLAGEPRFAVDECHVVFISNPQQQCLLWQQRATAASAPIVWDYHVILLETPANAETQVWDLDSCLQVPCPALQYVDETWPMDITVPPHLRPWFRLVAASEFRPQFASDRSHMKCGADWLAPPPPWPCIGQGHNLGSFIDMETPFVGTVVDLNGLRETFRLMH